MFGDSGDQEAPIGCTAVAMAVVILAAVLIGLCVLDAALT